MAFSECVAAAVAVLEELSKREILLVSRRLGGNKYDATLNERRSDFAYDGGSHTRGHSHSAGKSANGIPGYAKLMVRGRGGRRVLS